MAHPRLFPLRTPLVLGATVVALAVSAMPAYAGGDDCGAEAGDSSVRHLLGGDDCPPAPAPAQPAPVQPQPKLQPKPAPAPTQPVPVVRAPVEQKPKTTRPVTQQPVVNRVAPVQTRQVVQQAAVTRLVPRGGVQAGAGGTAPSAQPVSVIAIAALLLGLLSLGSGMRALRG
jgi:hypothetical protein